MPHAYTLQSTIASTIFKIKFLNFVQKFISINTNAYSEHSFIHSRSITTTDVYINLFFFFFLISKTHYISDILLIFHLSTILKLFPLLVSNNSPYSTSTCRCFWLLTRRVSWFQFHGRPWNPASFIAFMALTQFSKSFEACSPSLLRERTNSSFYLEFSSLFFFFSFATIRAKYIYIYMYKKRHSTLLILIQPEFLSFSGF